MMNSTISEVRIETPTVSTISFQWDQDVKVGQFIMIWVPGVGEVPMSISSTGKIKSVTVKEYGQTTQALRKLQAGERIYFRGPYGNSFTRKDGDILLVGGGSGMASLKPLIRKGAHAVVSARNERELLFADEFDENRVFKVTDDGSAGISGTPVDQLKTMDLENFAMIYVCGPELMLKAVMEHFRGRNLNAEFSLERIMKCGIGICDSCSIDGLQLCRDGPVFSQRSLEDMEEFGLSKLTESGTRIKL